MSAFAMYSPYPRTLLRLCRRLQRQDHDIIPVYKLNILMPWNHPIKKRKRQRAAPQVCFASLERLPPSAVSATAADAAAALSVAVSSDVAVTATTPGIVIATAAATQCVRIWAQSHAHACCTLPHLPGQRGRATTPEETQRQGCLEPAEPGAPPSAGPA